jgi:hypothetical protein
VINSIEDYLSQLRKEMNSCDPATIQDAVADAEEHLRLALENVSGADIESALATVIEVYGTPQETAEAYLSLETRFPVSLPKKIAMKNQNIFSRFFGIYSDPSAWSALLYMLLSLITGCLYFTIAVFGISLSISLIVFIIGIPVLALFLLSFRGIAIVEGRIVEALLGVRMPKRPVFMQPNLPWIQKLITLLKSKYTWFSLFYMILLFPLGTFYFCLFITLVALGLSLFVVPIFQYGFNMAIISFGNAQYMIQDWAMPLIVLAGLLILTLTLHLAKGIAFLHGKFAKAMLVMD